MKVNELSNTSINDLSNIIATISVKLLLDSVFDEENKSLSKNEFIETKIPNLLERMTSIANDAIGMSESGMPAKEAVELAMFKETLGDKDPFDLLIEMMGGISDKETEN